ncbi:MAG: glycosyltransferase [Pseudomonadota bacterium]
MPKMGWGNPVRSVLHISADYPDAYSQTKTKAILNLVSGTSKLRHRVYSINRLNGFGGVQEIGRCGSLITLIYRAPGYGLFLEKFLNVLADWIVADVLRSEIQVDLVHAHKFTIEGIAANRISQALGCPYLCTLRGNTDQKYLRFKPEKHDTFRRVAEEATQLLPTSPWIARDLSKRLKLHELKTTVLPTISASDRIIPPSLEYSRLVTAFHLDFWRPKGLPNLLKALQTLKQDGLEVELDILGGGADASVSAVRKLIMKHGLDGQVRLLGAVPHDEIQDRLNRYAAFVLPTLTETFGMVYIEALFSGIPILYSADRGVDGYFDEQDIGIRCDPDSVTSITDGLRRILRRAPEMKDALSVIQLEGELDHFRKDNVCRTYEDLVAQLAKPSENNPDNWVEQ